MHFLGGLKNKISTIYKGEATHFNNDHLDVEDLSHTLDVIQAENKILKSKVRVLENSVFGDNVDDAKSKFGKLFHDLKSSFIFSSQSKFTLDDSKSSINEFKSFLCDNLLFYNSIDEDDVDYLNNVHISNDDWDKNKEIFIYKQKILEKNYNEMFKNIIAGGEIDSKLNNERNVIHEEKQLQPNLKEKINIKKSVSKVESNTSELENILLSDGNSKSFIDKDKLLVGRINTPVEKTNVTPILNRILNLDENDEEFEISAVLKKEKHVSSTSTGNKSPFLAESSNSNESPIKTQSTGQSENGKISISKVSLNKKTESEDTTQNLFSSLLLTEDNSSKFKTSMQNSLINLKKPLSTIQVENSSQNSSNKNATNKTAKYAWDEDEDL